MRVVAQDSGNPPRSATAMVYVRVQRNFFAPSWEQTSTNIRILETQAQGVPFTRLAAVDRDRAVSEARRSLLQT